MSTMFTSHQSATPRRATIPSGEKSNGGEESMSRVVRQPEHNFEMVIGQVCARDISHDSLSASATEIRPDFEGHHNSATAVGIVVKPELSSHNDARFVEKPVEGSGSMKWSEKRK